MIRDQKCGEELNRDTHGATVERNNTDKRMSESRLEHHCGASGRGCYLLHFDGQAMCGLAGAQHPQQRIPHKPLLLVRALSPHLQGGRRNLIIAPALSARSGCISADEPAGHQAHALCRLAEYWQYSPARSELTLLAAVSRGRCMNPRTHLMATQRRLPRGNERSAVRWQVRGGRHAGVGERSLLRGRV